MASKAAQNRLEPYLDRILGKAQHEGVPFYLIRQNNQPFQKAQWLTGIEAFEKLHSMIVEYDRRKLKDFKLQQYFIDEQRLEKSHPESAHIKYYLLKKQSDVSFTKNPKEKVEQAFELQELKENFRQKFELKKKQWNSSAFAPLSVDLTRFRLKKKSSQSKLENQTQVQQQMPKVHQEWTFKRPKVSIDYDSLDLKNDAKDFELFLARILIHNHRLYLVKRSNQTLETSRWLYCHQTMKKYHPALYMKMKQISMKAKNLATISQSQVYIDKERIVYELCKETIYRDKLSTSNDSSLEINQKEFYQRAKQISKIFMQEAQKVKILVQEKFQNQIENKQKKENRNKNLEISESTIVKNTFKSNFQKSTPLGDNSLNYGDSQDDKDTCIWEQKSTQSQNKKLTKIEIPNQSQISSKQTWQFLEGYKKGKPEQKMYTIENLSFSQSDEEEREYEYEWLDEKGNYCCAIGGSRCFQVMRKTKNQDPKCEQKLKGEGREKKEVIKRQNLI